MVCWLHVTQNLPCFDVLGSGQGSRGRQTVCCCCCCCQYRHILPLMRTHREHLGLLESQGGASPNPDISVEDPVCARFYEEIWLKIAERNTSIYEKVSFHVVVYTLITTEQANMSLALQFHDVSTTEIFPAGSLCFTCFLYMYTVGLWWENLPNWCSLELLPTEELSGRCIQCIICNKEATVVLFNAAMSSLAYIHT